MRFLPHTDEDIDEHFDGYRGIELRRIADFITNLLQPKVCIRVRKPVSECSPTESKIQKGLLSGRSLKRIHPDTQYIYGRVMIAVCNKTTLTTMCASGQRFFDYDATR